MLYTVGAPGIKNHICTSYYLAQLVSQNLIDRYGASPTISTCDTEVEFFYDIGGMLYGVSKSFNISGLRIVCRGSQLECFMESVKELDSAEQLERYEGQFFKLHAENHVLCLTALQKDELLFELAKSILPSYNTEHNANVY